MKNTSHCESCEQLITEISYIRDVEINALEQKVQDACNVINELYEMLMDDTLVRNGTDLHFAEVFISEGNYIAVGTKVNNP